MEPPASSGTAPLPAAASQRHMPGRGFRNTSSHVATRAMAGTPAPARPCSTAATRARTVPTSVRPAATPPWFVKMRTPRPRATAARSLMGTPASSHRQSSAASGKGFPDRVSTKVPSRSYLRSLE